jgi:SAM-dependent methyltransferase
VARQTWPGWCEVCEESTVFRAYGAWHRDELFCTRCRSIPRHRAILAVLSLVRPDWRSLRLWEVAPAGPASRKLRTECAQYVGTHYQPGVAPGTVVKGHRCEDLERPTFDDGSFDIVVSSDVLEHIVDVDAAHGQIARVLAEDGVHVWTVPQHRELELSRPRVRRLPSGLEHLEPAEYHGDPVSREGALVTFDWGRDLSERVAAASGMWTTGFRIESRVQGLLGEFLEVFVSHRGRPDSGLHRAQSRVEAYAVARGRAHTIPVPPRVRIPLVSSYRSWWPTERLRDVRAMIRRRRGRRDR